MAQVKIILDLPKETLDFMRKSKNEMPSEIRKLLAMELVKEGKVPFGKGAEIAGLYHSDFLDYLAQYKVSIFQYTEDELSKELSSKSEFL